MSSILLRSLPRAALSTPTTGLAAQRAAFSTTRANALAKMQIIGRLADTPEATPTSTGRELVRYALGVSTGPRDEQGNRATSWFKVASFQEGPQREVLLSLPKGTLMYLEADAKMDTFQNSEGKSVTQLNLLQRRCYIFRAELVAKDEDDGKAKEDEKDARR
ncbi:hypothetical protein MBLNU230_g2692t2 [Neophaeotheca triangularis]